MNGVIKNYGGWYGERVHDLAFRLSRTCHDPANPLFLKESM